jgi:hypothetical protein
VISYGWFKKARLCFFCVIVKTRADGLQAGANVKARKQEVNVAERVFSIVTRPDTGLELYEIIQDHVRELHGRGMSKVVGYEVMSNGRVILLKVRGPQEDVMPADETLEAVLDDVFVERIEALAQELVDGFYMPSFAHCASEREE